MNDLTFFEQPLSLLELLAMLTGIAGVWLTIKKNIWCFPVGIINVTLYAWLFFTPGISLYADGLLQCFYILLLIYGWLMWKNKINQREQLQVSKINFTGKIKLLIIFIVSSASLSIFLAKYTSASYPVLDSTLTCASLIAQWMIAKKMIANWIIWIVVNLVYIPMYISKHLPLTAILYGVFLILAVRGYYEWKRNKDIHAT